MTKIALLALLAVPLLGVSQNKLTPELLWKIGRVEGLGISKDGKFVVYSVRTPDVQQNKMNTRTYMIPVTGGTATQATNPDSLLDNKNLSPDGKYLLNAREVKEKKIFGVDYYPDLSKSNAYIFDSLGQRHWDAWEDGKFGHLFVAPIANPSEEKDIMAGEPFDCPQKPFGGDEDYVWAPDSKSVIYVCKKKYGTSYALSTNTELYRYDLATGETTCMTAELKNGYDTNPSYSPGDSSSAVLAWLSMKREGYEADKQDLLVSAHGAAPVNLTQARDDLNVESFRWSHDGTAIYFCAAVNGTLQLFEVNNALSTDEKSRTIRQITMGNFDITGIVGESGSTLIVSRTDMNHAPELFTVDPSDGNIKQLTYVNDSIYSSLSKCRTQRRWITTTDNKKMLTWVIYPPDFDSTKKYPTLLYCQGGPQSALTQTYSFRWNFQLMASQGYIVVAPNRRGMPGHGTKWNEQISKDWGGQVMKDYLAAIDAVAKEKFVDKDRLGCVGASYGGYSVFMLAGIHNNRFKTFIAHDGTFDLRSWYGTTEELWFPNWDIGGPYWQKTNAAAQKSYTQFSPSNFVDKWNTPIMIIQGGKDYRVPIEQGLQAFQAAQLRGIKSKLLYLPDENHWVSQPQDALVWQHEFFNWLTETLPEKSNVATDKKGF